MKEKSESEKLLRQRESVWTAGDAKKVNAFSEDYKEFLFRSKTERAATRTILETLKKEGFRDIQSIDKLQAGDKVYLNLAGKSVICAVMGTAKDRFHLVGSHIDSPRLDLKPNPLFEASGMALFKTHYYGGIKKYQWTNVELALYGVLHTQQGKRIEFAIGEQDDEPRFIVSDLLPHLAKKQMEKTGNEIVEAEQLNIYVGNIPVQDKDAKDKVKLQVLEHLNKKYGIIEEDFSFAELNFVPAGRPHDIGFDRSLIAGYGHDDKVCSYGNLRAIVDMKSPAVTAVSYFSDKEEIGSIGNTGAYSFVLLDFAEMLVDKCGLKMSAKALLKNSKAVSADVSTIQDPNFPDVSDDKNSFLNTVLGSAKGVIVPHPLVKSMGDIMIINKSAVPSYNPEEE